MKNRIGSKLSALLLLLAVLGSSLVTLVGCNTTAGIGEDIEAAGEAINKKAEEEKKY